MPPVSTVKSSATPISADQLQQELSKSSAPRQDAPREAAPKPDAPKAPAALNMDDDAPAQRADKSAVPNLMENIRKGVMDKKPDAAAAPDAEDKGTKPEGKKPDAKKKEAISADDAPPIKHSEELSEEEKGVMPHDSARVRARILYLAGEKKRVEAESAAIRKELEEAKKAPPSAASAEEVTALKAEHAKLQDEATKLRRRYDWENDGEAKAKYREPVAAAEKAIEEAFKRSGFGETTLAAIKEAGGFAAFSRSKTTYPIEVADPDAEGGKKLVNYTAAELARSWLTKMPIADAQLINQSVGRQEMLQAEEKTAIQKAMDESKTYFENQTAGQRKAQEEAKANTDRLSAEYETWAKKAETDTDFLKDAEIPEGASEAEKKTLTERNAFAAELRAGLKKHPTTSLEYGQLKLDAAKSRHLERTMAEKDAEIERLTGELKKKAAAQRTTGKGGSLLVKDGHKPDEEKKVAGDTNFMDAINKRMAQKAGSADED